ncbi:hypothetical protein [Aestuariibius sp. HNIBRBA575]|uniref:hypothetical protein n=1 Tax=Aestuariibius sp. HNIBRBA575 TaxID=3233343 RepID=UPI0034A3805E
MSRVRKIVTLGGTFAVALGIGFVMQNGDALASRFASDDTTTTQDVTPIANANPSGIGPADIQPPAEMAMVGSLPIQDKAPVMPAEPIHLAAALDDQGLADLLPHSADAGIATSPECEVTMSATIAPMAMVDLSVTAPCAPVARVTIHHQGMMFTTLTDASGIADVQVPALAETAIFIAAFENGSGGLSTVTVPELAMYDRAVLQWQGQSGLQIHAREFGADYGQDGHIWNAATGTTDGTTGFMVRLGADHIEAPLLAEVYTFPSGTASRDGSIALSAEAEITAGNCGRQISAQSLQISPGSLTEALDLTLTMPDCDAVGDFLVLKNMFQDLTLAAR